MFKRILCTHELSQVFDPVGGGEKGKLTHVFFFFLCVLLFRLQLGNCKTANRLESSRNILSIIVCCSSSTRRFYFRLFQGYCYRTNLPNFNRFQITTIYRYFPYPKPFQLPDHNGGLPTERLSPRVLISCDENLSNYFFLNRNCFKITGNRNIS